MLQCQQHHFCVFCVIINIWDDQSQRVFLRKWHYLPLRYDVIYDPFPINRPLALRGLVTNASFKQWLGILWMTKIDIVHKNYLTHEIWEETHLREIFYGTSVFQQSSMNCIGSHVGGMLLLFNMTRRLHDGQNNFLLVSCLIVMLRCALNVIFSTIHHVIFSTISVKLKCKISVQEEVIHSFKNQILVTWPAIYEHPHIFKKIVQVCKTKALFFCLRYDPLIVFWRQNHITFIKMMSHDF